MSDRNSPPNECILAIGDTGLGKSFTATVFGAKNVKVGHSTKSETKVVTFYGIGNGSIYVDTPGFNDTDEEKNDEKTVHLILKALEKRKIFNITTILWFVRNECKAAASFKRQANVIEAFARDHKGNVWDNTIIVTKGDESGKGPRAAAEEIAKTISEEKIDYKYKLSTEINLLKNTENFEILLFESLTERKQRYYKSLTDDEMNEENVFEKSKPERILTKYRSLMEGHKNHPIVFAIKKFRCKNCNEYADPRQASPKCHLKPKNIHTAGLEYYHSQTVGNFHAAEVIEEWDHSVGAWTIRIITIGIVNPLTYKWNCCGKWVYATGCQSQYKCCRKVEGRRGCERRYSCCREAADHDKDNCGKCISGDCKVLGCKSVCSRCEKVPRESKGCSFEGKHDWSSL